MTLLQRLYVLEQIPAWHPALRSPIKLRQAPKRMLVDPSLAVAGLNASPADLKRDPKTLGFLFESMILRDSGDVPPAAMIVIVGVGGVAHRRDDGVYVIPADIIGP